jgi:uncharacterized protein involved in exopolysaccharide biosynthesis
MSLIGLDPRALLSIFFRRLGRIALVVIGLNVLVLAYVLLASPQYQSNAKLLIKFGQDARPNVSSTNGGGLTAEEKRGLVQSNLNILTSRDLLEALLKDMTIAKAYPDIAASPRISDEATMLDTALRRLAKNLRTQTQSDAATIHVGLRHSEAALSAEMLKRLIALFVQRQLDVYNNPQTGFITQQSEQAATRLTEANRKLSEFQTSVGIASIEEELSLLLRQRSELESYIARRQDAPATISGNNAVPARLPSVNDSSRAPVLDDVQEELARLRAKESELLQTYRADSDQVKAIRRSISQQQSRLESTVAALSTQITDLDKKIETLRGYKATSDELSLQVRMAEEAYRATEQRLQSAQVNDALNRELITSFSVIEQPSTPLRPVAPNKKLLIAVGLLLSIVLAGLVVLLSEILDPTISRSEQVRGLLGAPLLASFPRQSANPLQSALALYRSLTTLSERPAVALASCQSSEHSLSDVASALAELCSSKLQQKVLVLTETSNGAPGQVSLLDLVSGKADKARLLQGVGTEPGVLELGLCTPDQREQLLGNLDALSALLRELRSQFDVTLLLLPNANDAFSATLAQRLTEGTVLLVEAEKTRLPVAKQALAQLSDAGTKLLGVALDRQRFYIPSWAYRYL